MTIEEAIQYELSGGVIPPTKYMQTYREQIAEWLKELRHYQLGNCMNDCEHYDNCSNYIYSKGYSKAIDDFVEKLDNHTFVEKIETNYSNSVSFMREIGKMAEQLKNERN